MVWERFGYRVLYWIFAVGVLQAAGLLLFELYRAPVLSREIRRLEAENQALWQRARALEHDLLAAQEPGFLEAAARRLGWVKRNEVLYPRKTP